MFLFAYGLASGLFAALIAVFLYSQNETTRFTHATETSFVIISTVSAFGILRMGLASTKAEKSISSLTAAAGASDAVGVMRSALSFLLLKVDQSTHDSYMNYLNSVASEIRAKAEWSYGTDRGNLVSFCGSVAGLTSSISLEGNEAMNAFRRDIEELGNKGLTEPQKTFLMLRVCVHHVGKKNTILAAAYKTS
jgi:hypothetical protein